MHERLQWSVMRLKLSSLLPTRTMQSKNILFMFLLYGSYFCPGEGGPTGHDLRVRLEEIMPNTLHFIPKVRFRHNIRQVLDGQATRRDLRLLVKQTLYVDAPRAANVYKQQSGVFAAQVEALN